MNSSGDPGSAALLGRQRDLEVARVAKGPWDLHYSKEAGGMTKFTTHFSAPGLRPEVLIPPKSKHTTSKKEAER